VLEDYGIPYTETSVDIDSWPQAKLVYENYPFSQSACVV
jgi:hypothetical protein